MGKIEKGSRCTVRGCGGEAVRSLSMDKVKSAGLSVEGSGRAYLCEAHYKEYKKKTRADRKLERARWGGI